MWRLARYLWVLYVVAAVVVVWLGYVAPQAVAFELSLRETVPTLERRVGDIEARLVTVPPERIDRLERKIDMLIAKLDAAEEREKAR